MFSYINEGSAIYGNKASIVICCYNSSFKIIRVPCTDAFFTFSLH